MVDEVVEQVINGGYGEKDFLEHIKKAPICSIKINHLKDYRVDCEDLLNKFMAVESPFKMIDRMDHKLFLTLSNSPIPHREYLECVVGERENFLDICDCFRGGDTTAAIRSLAYDPAQRMLRASIYGRVYKDYKDLLYLNGKHAHTIYVKFADLGTKRSLRLIQKYLLQLQIDSLDLD